MGLTLEFWVGNDKKIIKGVSDVDFDIFDEKDVVEKKADFPLHIVPRDLNTLSIVTARFNQQKPMGLRDFLNLVINEADHGLFKVDKLWLKYFIKVNPNDLEELANEWFRVMQGQYPNENLKVTSDAIQAVKDLFYICEYAINERKTVFHYWLG